MHNRKKFIGEKQTKRGWKLPTNHIKNELSSINGHLFFYVKTKDSIVSI